LRCRLYAASLLSPLQLVSTATWPGWPRRHHVCRHAGHATAAALNTLVAATVTLVATHGGHASFLHLLRQPRQLFQYDSHRASRHNTNTGATSLTGWLMVVGHATPRRRLCRLSSLLAEVMVANGYLIHINSLAATAYVTLFHAEEE